MCGISGVVRSRIQGHALLSLVSEMNDRLIHRGPDSGAVWIDSELGVALGHRRLSVLDLGETGAQPMISSSNRYVIVFNGEIYNHLELRREFPNHAWRGRSDTETLLELLERWGVEKALNRLTGMFAFALFDRKQRELILVRDRFGEKPIYYGLLADTFVFASELKALRALPSKNFVVDERAACSMLRHGYVPAPYSIYEGVFKLPPGNLVRVNIKGKFGEPERWWDFPSLVLYGVSNQSSYSDSGAVDQLEVLLGESVKNQMVADVPLGALLSGGLDSSLITALMQKNSNGAVNTFTIGFAENNYNEATDAKKIARHLGTNHREFFVSARDSLDLIPKLSSIWDEPFGDSSQLATALVCSLARQNVKVCLSGDGGDELFGGYNRYFWGSLLWRKLDLLPVVIRKAVAGVFMAVPVAKWDFIFAAFSAFIPDNLAVSNAGDKLHKLSELIGARTKEELYLFLTSQWREELPLKGRAGLKTLFSRAQHCPSLNNFAEEMMAADTLTYLPDDILVKVDRAAMASGLETRAPFLDEKLLRFAWSLPFNMKVRHGQGKWLLRQLLYRYLPKELVNRSKKGFAVPLDQWLRGPLRDWAEDLLSFEALAEDGFLDPKPIRNMWHRHLSGHNVQHAVWNVLMYQSWRRCWGRG